jgi:hypothetical protein
MPVNRAEMIQIRAQG